ncbi:hypothetical protein [Pseudomonas sp. N040]|uniref:hypothetical protein n=1 Tax=Pseudomonas sp. N040 TaxID=2785325 RepID=UPI0018A31CAB|nr:hypothetical protein [Pseudomonas sp. N040]MBF7731019.1 hypothetical protein [Pseudomonas sp. N040]MBW7014662.1 hypothetical protein [Pseudomonas sp. N040]
MRWASPLRASTQPTVCYFLSGIKKPTLWAEMVKQWKPCEKSTGPTTPEGKAKSAMRGYKGGQRSLMRELSKLLKEHRNALEQMSE